MRTFVMGDIHGTFTALRQCLDRSGFDKQEDALIQLGDIADGFGEVYECVEELLTIPNLVAIRGNHDAWFHEFIETGIHPDRWSQGGAATARSYLRRIGKEEGIFAGRDGYKTALNPADIPEPHQQFFRRQHLYYIDESNNCFVHGGFNRRLPFKGQPPEVYYWDRELWSAALSCKPSKKNRQEEEKFPPDGEKPRPKEGTLRTVTPFHKIFIGHTSTISWHTDQPMTAANVHNLDTGAGHAGRLTIMELTSQQFWQSDPVKELYGARP